MESHSLVGDGRISTFSAGILMRASASSANLEIQLLKTKLPWLKRRINQVIFLILKTKSCLELQSLRDWKSLFIKKSGKTEEAYSDSGNAQHEWWPLALSRRV